MSGKTPNLHSSWKWALAIQRKTFASKLSLRIYKAITVSITLLLFKTPVDGWILLRLPAMVRGWFSGPQKLGRWLQYDTYLREEDDDKNLRMETKQNGLCQEIRKLRKKKKLDSLLITIQNKSSSWAATVCSANTKEKEMYLLRFAYRHESWALWRWEIHLKYRRSLRRNAQALQNQGLLESIVKWGTKY